MPIMQLFNVLTGQSSSTWGWGGGGWGGGVGFGGAGVNQVMINGA